MPGQSIEEEIGEVSYDGALAPLMLAVMMSLLAGLEWYRYLTGQKFNPIVYTIGALCCVAWAIWRVTRTAKKVKQLKLGRDGERAVAQYLEWFRTSGFFVFHDVPIEGANIDHVLVGQRGVFTIETKTHSKPERGECRIRLEGERVFANGRELDRSPVIQAKAQARWVHNFLKDAQFTVFVHPVVVFPGWFVEPFDNKSVGVWVLEPKALDGYLAREPERISREDAKAMASALASYIRAQAKF